ncbi:mechanosensitive ion channel [Planomicrobium okeanokoites]|uniref:mechanosensitive ion channel n=2 Tax=Planomicrobium okeanokoites TaxID=244 RepID=UPI0009FCD49C|nr:mechanosensitive ion channel [Planomicrobium okeanokoites]
MDTRGYFNNFMNALPEILLAILVLIIGFIVAKVVEKAVYKLLDKTKLDEKAGMSQQKYSLSKIISKIVFVLILLFAVALFFNILNLGAIGAPFLGIFDNLSGAFLSILKAALILLLAWVLATVVKRLILVAGRKFDFGKVTKKTGASKKDTVKWTETAANIAFYLILLLFLPAVLSALNIDGLSEPFSNMLASVLNFIPKLIAAAIIFAIGWIAATIVKKILSKFLESIGTDRLASKLKISQFFSGTSVSNVIGIIAFILIMLPVTIAALEVLALRGISGPAIAMLNDILTMIPNIIVAILLILAGIIIGRWVKDFVVQLMKNLGVDSLTEKMGMNKTADPDTDPSAYSLARIIGVVAQVLIILLFTVEALQLLNLEFMVSLATGIFAYIPAVIAALVILAIGFWLANLAEDFIGSVFKKSSGGPHVLRYVAKYAILAFAFFMALDQLGIAASIINSAFILILGGAALAFGLAFGLGGKEHASRYLDRMENSLKETEVDKEKWEEKKREQEAKKVGLAKEAKAAVDPIVEKTSPDERHPFEESKDTKGPTTDFPKNFNQDAHDSWNGRNRNMDDPFNDK